MVAEEILKEVEDERIDKITVSVSLGIHNLDRVKELKKKKKIKKFSPIIDRLLEDFLDQLEEEEKQKK